MMALSWISEGKVHVIKCVMLPYLATVCVCECSRYIKFMGHQNCGIHKYLMQIHGQYMYMHTCKFSCRTWYLVTCTDTSTIACSAPGTIHSKVNNVLYLQTQNVESPITQEDYRWDNALYRVNNGLYLKTDTKLLHTRRL